MRRKLFFSSCPLQIGELLFRFAYFLRVTQILESVLQSLIERCDVFIFLTHDLRVFFILLHHPFLVLFPQGSDFLVYFCAELRLVRFAFAHSLVLFIQLRSNSRAGG